MKIGIDIADTIIDVWPSIMQKATEFNKQHSNNPKSDNRYLYLPEDIFNWSEEERKEFWTTFGQEITFSVPVKPGVKETIEYLKNMEYLIYFVTAKSNDIYANLEKNIVSLLNDNGILYDGIYTQINSKGKFCYENGFNYLIDDSYRNCLEANQYGVTSMLVTNTYNLGREILDNMYRINDFSDIQKVIRRF